MSWRLRAIGLYSKRHGELRDLRFEPESLNLVLGRSARGKSSVLDIVNYTLLSKSCPIAKGVIRKHVSHVGAVLVKKKMKVESAEERLVIVRPLPPDGQATTSDVHVERGRGIWFSERPPEVCRFNLDTAKEILSEFTGIEAAPVLTNDRSSDPDEKHAVNIRHCSCFLFQPQDVIASRNVTFPGVEDIWVKRHVGDALDYFLQVLSLETLAKRQELRELQAKKRKLEQTAQEAARLRARGFERGMSLRNEGIVLGILPNTEEPTTLQQLIEILKTAEHVPLTDVTQTIQLLEYQKAQEEEARLRQKIREKELEYSEIERFTAAATRHETVTANQVERLKLKELLPRPEKKQCPLCQSGEVDPQPIEQRLEEGISLLSAVSVAPVRLSSRMNLEQKRLQGSIQEMKAQHLQAQDRLRKLIPLQQAQVLTAEAQRKQRYIGHTVEYLAAVGTNQTTHTDELKKITAQIDRLNKEVGDGTLREKRQTIQKQLTDRMTELTRELDVEFPGAPVRLNVEKLLIEVSLEPEKWTPLDELGSGANWLSYHLVAAIGLHQIFRELKSPVPALLIVDQPSQVWFPVETEKPRGDVERRAVERVYRLLHKCSSKEGYPQIIAIDHAKFSDQWFVDCIAAEWRENSGLVPYNWIIGE